MDNASHSNDENSTPKDDWKMEAVFREKKDFWKGFLRGLLLMAVLGIGFWIYFKSKKPPVEQLSDVPNENAVEKMTTPDAAPIEKPVENPSEKTAEKTPENQPEITEKITEPASPTATPLSFAQLAHDLFSKNDKSVAPAKHPIRQGMNLFRNGKFTSAAKVFEAVLDSSENEKISAEADYFLLLSFLADQPEEKEKYQAQLDRLLEQKKHPKFQQAGEVKRAVSKFEH